MMGADLAVYVLVINFWRGGAVAIPYPTAMACARALQAVTGSNDKICIPGPAFKWASDQ